MYKKFFNLKENPFNVNPDPRYLFATRSTQEALACLTYGIETRKGFILLTGEVGTGKTTLLNKLLEWLHQNFLGKKNLLKAMADTAVHATFEHVLNRDGQAVISYSDDHSAASLDATFAFLDPDMIRAVKKNNSYGLCIMYFQKQNGRWCLKTVHLDIHCTFCSI